MGPRPGRAGERHLARRHPRVRQAVGGAPAHAAHRQGRGGRPARGPDGQLRGRPSQPRCGRDRAAGPRAHRRRRRGRLAGRERDPAGGDAGRAARPPHRPGLRGRGALLARPPRGARQAGRRVRRRGSGDPRVHRRARHVADLRGRLPRPRGELGHRPCRLGRRTVLRDGPRQALGPHREGHQAAGRRRGRPPCRHRRGGRARRLRARRDRRVHHAHDRRGRGADPARRLRDRVQLPPRPDAADHGEADRDGRPLRDDGRVRRGLDASDPVPAQAARHHARQGDLRPRA